MFDPFDTAENKMYDILLHDTFFNNWMFRRSKYTPQLLLLYSSNNLSLHSKGDSACM
jgi:hypothetical protein